MKTYEQLMTKYWGETVPMAEAAGIDPWQCVRYCGGSLVDHPKFNIGYEDYTFALTVLEKRPVFICDELWHKENEIWTTILFEHCLKRNIDKYTWTPPTKKRTFTMEFDEEEMEFLTECHTARIVHISLSRSLNYRAKQILDAARDKE